MVFKAAQTERPCTCIAETNNIHTAEVCNRIYPLIQFMGRHTILSCAQDKNEVNCRLGGYGVDCMRCMKRGIGLVVNN